MYFRHFFSRLTDISLRPLNVERETGGEVVRFLSLILDEVSLVGFFFLDCPFIFIVVLH